MQTLRKALFVLFSSIFLVGLFVIMKLWGIAAKQALLVLTGSIISLLIYLKENNSVTAEWIAAGILPLAIFMTIRESLAITPYTGMALAFTVMLIAPPILMAVREKLFGGLQGT